CFRVGILPRAPADRRGPAGCDAGRERRRASRSRHVFQLRDPGEGTVEAEIVAWHVKPGDVVAEDDVIVEVMTDKAAVEVPAPVAGRVVSTTGERGDKVPVGATLIVLETGGDGATKVPSVQPPACISSHQTNNVTV